MDDDRYKFIVPEEFRKGPKIPVSLPEGYVHDADTVILQELTPVEDQNGKTVLKHKPFSKNKADKMTKEIIDEYYERYLEGDDTAILDLLYINREFIQLEWVSNCISKWYRNGEYDKLGKLYKKRRGRPEDNLKWSFWLMVESLVNTKGYSKEEAFAELEGRRIFGKALSYDTIKKNYYDCVKSHKREPLLFRFPPGTLCKKIP